MISLFPRFVGVFVRVSYTIHGNGAVLGVLALVQKRLEFLGFFFFWFGAVLGILEGLSGRKEVLDFPSS